jgi:hypothetical protein
MGVSASPAKPPNLPHDGNGVVLFVAASKGRLGRFDLGDDGESVLGGDREESGVMSDGDDLLIS